MCFNRTHVLETIDNATKHSMVAVKPRAGYGGDEELTAIGVWPGIGHREHAWAIMLQSVTGKKKVLVTHDNAATAVTVFGE